MINQKPKLISPILISQLKCDTNNNNFFKYIKNINIINNKIIFILIAFFILCALSLIYKSSKNNKDKEMEILYKKLKLYKKKRKDAEKTRLEQNIELQKQTNMNLSGYNFQ